MQFPFMEDQKMHRTALGSLLAAFCLLLAAPAAAQVPTLRIGHGISNEEPLWLMAVRPDLTPGQGKKYTLRLTPMTTPIERFQAFLAGELEGGTAPAFNVLLSRSQGVDVKLVAAIMQEARGDYFSTTLMVKDASPIRRAEDLKGKVVAAIMQEARGDYFSTTLMVKDASPIRRAEDLKGKVVGVLGFRTSPDLALRGYLLRSGLVPDVDVKVVPVPFPAMGAALRSDKIDVGSFVEPFFSAERAKGGLRPLVTAAEALGFDHDVLNIWLGSRLIREQPEAVRAFVSDYAATLKHYLANREAAKREVHKAGFVRAPLEVYLGLGEYKRDPQGRVDVASLARLAALMHEQFKWLERPASAEDLVAAGVTLR